MFRSLRWSPTRVAVLATALVAGIAAPALSATPAAAVGLPPAALPARLDRPAIQPLPANLEAIRANEATALYGAPEIRPIEQRQTAILTMGDSEISGEGVGNYVPGTHQNGNWCDRSVDQAVFRTGIAADQQYNIACSGAQPRHLVYGSGHSQWNELNQGDHLAIKARNVNLRLVWVVVGANGPNTIEFGPVATACALARLTFAGPCYDDYTDVWATRVEGSRQEVEAALASIKQTMHDAGYLASDYELVFMSYPSPASPDVEDNPNFPGWYSGGCVLYLHDLAFARNKAVPMFETKLRQAALNQGVRYLDASRLFHGYEVCETSPSVRGLFIELGIWNENAARQSFHPNYRGHGMFASCITDFYSSGLPSATCVAPNSTGATALVGGLLEFRQLKNSATGKCIDANGYNSRVGTRLESYGCHGGRNQGFWYDPTRQTINIELSHDRCLGPDGSLRNGTDVKLYDCNGSAQQKWVFSGQQIKAADNTNLCLGFDNPFLGLWTPRLEVQNCSSSNRQKFDFQTRNDANPVGYGHDDFIGSRVY